MNKVNLNQISTHFAVELKKINKRFPNGILANKDIDFNLKYGEIHALFGENGAGKSTLIKILFGNLKPTSGEIFINDQKIFNHNPKMSQEFDMAVVHQHFALIDNFSVFENVILGFETSEEAKIEKLNKKYQLKFDLLEKQKNAQMQKLETKKNLTSSQKRNEINSIEAFYKTKVSHLNSEKNHKMKSFFCYDQGTQKDIKKIVQKFKLGLSLNDLVANLGVTKKQKTEILRVLFRKAKIIIFDESTSTISPSDVKVFLDFLLQCKKEGKAIVFISHKVREIKLVADRITVLRKGAIVGSFANSEVEEAKLVNLMVGDKKLLPIRDVVRKSQSDLKILSAKNINLWSEGKQLLKNVNFDLYSGEIVALFGIEENGQRPLLESISQIETKWIGDITFTPKKTIKNKKHPLMGKNARDVKKLGIAYVPQDRQKEGILINDSLYLNTFFNNLHNDDWFSFGFIRKNKILKRTQEIVKKYSVHGGSSPENRINSLSGGNQQKFIIGREMETAPELILIDDPTWGIDVGMINFFSLEFIKRRNEGKTIFFSSPDLDLVLSLSDRVLVINNGQIMGEVISTTANARDKIGTLLAEGNIKKG